MEIRVQSEKHEEESGWGTIAETDEYRQMVQAIRDLLNHAAAYLVQHSYTASIDDVRYYSGRVAGIESVLDLLTKATKRSSNGES